jgi:hypothetical protein
MEAPLGALAMRRAGTLAPRVLLAFVFALALAAGDARPVLGASFTVDAIRGFVIDGLGNRILD